MKKYQEYWDYILEHNKGRREKTKEKLYKRILNRRRDWKKQYDIKDIDTLILKSLGTDCPYCETQLTTENIGLDHKTPISRGGSNNPENIHLTCHKCNKRKGEMTDQRFTELLQLLDTWEEEDRRYVLQHLSANIWSMWK